MAFVAVIKFVYTKSLTETVLTEVLNIEAGVCQLSMSRVSSVKNNKNPDEVHE